MEKNRIVPEPDLLTEYIEYLETVAKPGCYSVADFANYKLAREVDQLCTAMESLSLALVAAGDALIDAFTGLEADSGHGPS